LSSRALFLGESDGYSVKRMERDRWEKNYLVIHEIMKILEPKWMIDIVLKNRVGYLKGQA
jgi:hypothetical protein